MKEIDYKIALTLLVLTMNFIRIYYQARYKKTHAEKQKERKPVREKILVGIMTFSLACPGLLWLLTSLLDFAQFPLHDFWRISGFLIGVYGMWLFYRVHKILGDNWSPVLEIRKEHELIVAGPYAYVRHPMYSSMLLWSVSFSLLTANWFYAGCLWTGVFILLFFRVPDEENLMYEQFGAQYLEYKEKTRRLIPYLF